MCKTPTTPTEAMRRSSGLKFVATSSQVFGELVQLAHGRLGVSVGSVEAMLDMVLDQLASGVADSAFDCMELLGQINAGAAFLEHRKDRGEVAVRAFQARDNIRDG